MRRLRALTNHLPADAATRLHSARATPAQPPRPRTTSTPDQIRAAGGRFIHAPKKAVG